MPTPRPQLAARRRSRGLTQEDLAHKLGVDRSTVVRWEMGETKPQPWVRRKLAKALGLSLDELALLFDGTPPGASVAPVVTARPGMTLSVAINGHVVLVPVDAETVARSGLAAIVAETSSATTASAEQLSGSAGARPTALTHHVAAVALPALGLEELHHVAVALDDAGRYLDETVVSYFGRQLEVCKTNDGALGPAAALPLVLNILSAIDQHARSVSPDMRRSLVKIGAETAEFAAWLYRDLRQPAAAGFWHDRAIEWAQEAGDLAMQGYVLLRKSQMAYEERDSVRVLTLAQAAHYGPWQLAPAVRAEVIQQEARGMAMLGESFAAVEQKLDDARGVIAAVRQGDEASGQFDSYRQDGAHLLRAASVYVEAGKPARAASLFEEVLIGHDLPRRDQGYFRARRSVALALSGEPDAAADEGVAALQLATAIQSGRTKRELSRAVAILQPWSSRPGPRRLREAMAGN